MVLLNFGKSQVFDGYLTLGPSPFWEREAAAQDFSFEKISFDDIGLGNYEQEFMVINNDYKISFEKINSTPWPPSPKRRGTEGEV